MKDLLTELMNKNDKLMIFSNNVLFVFLLIP